MTCELVMLVDGWLVVMMSGGGQFLELYIQE